MAQCTATSKRTGERCKRMCAPGKTVCKWHGGNSKGAPKGNKNALKHGAYESISLETMFPDEIEYANSISLDPLTTLQEQLRFLRVKEARLAKRMKKALEAEMNAEKDDGTGRRAVRWWSSPPPKHKPRISRAKRARRLRRPQKRTVCNTCGSNRRILSFWIKSGVFLRPLPRSKA